MPRRFGGFNQGNSFDKAKVIVVVASFLLVILAGSFLLISNFSNSSDAVATATIVQKEPAQPAMADVLVSIQNIEPGTPLEPTLFKKESRQSGSLPPQVVKDFSELVGQYARIAIVSNQLLAPENMTRIRPINTITASIPEGFRAVTINVNATSSVEGYALPGARVDIVWASRINGRQGVTVIVQNAKVISAERNPEANAKPGSPVPSTVTLLVTAEDATKIQLAQTTGALSLSLRGDGDAGKGAQGSSITVDDLLGKSPSISQPRKPGITVKVRRPDGKLEELVLGEDGKLVSVPGANEQVEVH